MSGMLQTLDLPRDPKDSRSSTDSNSSGKSGSADPLKTSRIAYPVREKGAEPPKSKNCLLDVYRWGKFTITLLLSRLFRLIDILLTLISYGQFSCRTFQCYDNSIFIESSLSMIR